MRGDLPKEVPVVGQGEVKDLSSRQGLVDEAVCPKGESQQGHKHRRPVPARDTVDQQAFVSCSMTIREVNA